jgi:hypothetical protein
MMDNIAPPNFVEEILVFDPGLRRIVGDPTYFAPLC